MISRYLKSCPDCIFFKHRKSSVKLKQSAPTTPLKNSSVALKDFRINNPNHKRTNTANFLMVPATKQRLTGVDKPSKDGEESDGSLPASKNGSVRLTDRSDRSMVAPDDKTKEENKPNFTVKRPRIASGPTAKYSLTPSEKSAYKYYGMGTPTQKKEMLRKSASCLKGFSLAELPPLPKKSSNKLSKQSVRLGQPSFTDLSKPQPSHFNAIFN